MNNIVFYNEMIENIEKLVNFHDNTIMFSVSLLDYLKESVDHNNNIGKRQRDYNDVICDGHKRQRTDNEPTKIYTNDVIKMCKALEIIIQSLTISVNDTKQLLNGAKNLDFINT
jgi:hypothetical protein